MFLPVYVAMLIGLVVFFAFFGQQVRKTWRRYVSKTEGFDGDRG